MNRRLQGVCPQVTGMVRILDFSELWKIIPLSGMKIGQWQLKSRNSLPDLNLEDPGEGGQIISREL